MIPGDIRRLPELAVNSGAWRLEVRPPRLVFVRGFLLAPEHHHNPALWVELHDHVRAFVDRPDVVIFVHADSMSERPSVQIFSYLADIVSIGTKLEQLRCACA